MAALNFYPRVLEGLAEGQHNLQDDEIRIALASGAPNASHSAFSDLTEVAAGSGYAAGGETTPVTASEMVGLEYHLTLSDVVFTASGGTIGPFRTIAVYNATSGLLIAYYDYGADFTIAEGSPFELAFTSEALVLRIASAT